MPEDCIHCGTPLESSQEASGFCCTGCEFVYQLIHEEGLENFYALKHGETTTPLRDQPFQQHDFTWLADTIQSYETEHADSSSSEFEGFLQGISCIGCVWLVEKLFLRHEGALRCDIIPATGTIHLTWKRDIFQPIEFAQELQRFGYLLGVQRPMEKGSGELHQLGGRLGICGAFALNAMGFSLPRYLGMPTDFAFAGIFDLVTFLSATLAMLVGGSWFIKRAVQSVRTRVIHMDMPIALGISLAYLGSLVGWLGKYEGLIYFDFVAIFTFLMLGGRWLQSAAVERNRNRLLEQTPIPLSVKNSDDGETVEINDVKKGIHYLLPSGQTAPVASIVVQGGADFSLEWINGEAEPVHRTSGMPIPAGAINISDNTINLTSSEDWQDSLLSKLIRSGESSSRSLRLERILRYYLMAVLAIGMGGGLVWLFAGKPITAALQVTISVFVISCPCALGVALPLADELASGRMRSLGVFIRRPAFWSRILQIKTIFFDKTGTLTMDLPRLKNSDSIIKLDDHSLSVLMFLCQGSQHPYSRSLVRELGIKGQTLLKDQPRLLTNDIAGLGSHLQDASGQPWSLGKCGWHGQDEEVQNTSRATRPGCELRRNGELVAYFEFEEYLRPDAAKTLKLLKNYHPHILSGDHTDRVTHIANILDIHPSVVHAGLTPEEKAQLVEKIDANHSLFLGDGANDSLAFDAAAMTGAVAGRGLLESKADFYFLSSGLHFIPAMLNLAKKHSHAVKSVFTFSVIYNAIAIAVCLAGFMNPLLAAILMPLSSLISLGIVTLILPIRSERPF